MKPFAGETETAVVVLHEEIPDAKNIRYIMADSNCVWIFMNNGKVIFDNKTLKHYETYYSENEFYRINHKYLINTAGELFIKPLNARKYIAILPCKTELEISYRRKDGFILFLINRKNWNCARINELFVNNSAIIG